MAERILIVEDEKLLRWALRERLGKEGYEPIEAESGAAARRLLGTEELDLALLDYRLPDMTGLDLLREILAHHPDVPVILMTAYLSLIHI